MGQRGSLRGYLESPPLDGVEEAGGDACLCLGGGGEERRSS
jgi:hypothetical protein